MTIINWIVWEEGNRVAGIDFNCTVDVSITFSEWSKRDRSTTSVTRVHSEEEWSGAHAFWRERARWEDELWCRDDDDFDE